MNLNRRPGGKGDAGFGLDYAGGDHKIQSPFQQGPPVFVQV